MNAFPTVRDLREGNAIVYCQGAFGTTNGKTAHGVVRRTERYRVLSVVDSRYAGADAGEVLDSRPNGIRIFAGVREAFLAASNSGNPATHLVVGLAPDGGRLPEDARADIRTAIALGLDIDSGLHDFLSDDPELTALAKKHGVRIRDIRKTSPRSELHFFSGKIEEVKSLKIAILGTDSAVGKRTTAWILIDALRAAGLTAEMVGTGQTAWMQGAKYSIILDSLINDFVSGEIEHAVWSAWKEARPDVIVIEGQGSLLNPAYPGGFEILAAGRPDAVILQHAPARRDYDGFPGYRIHPLSVQIQAIQLISSKPVVAVTVNHENMAGAEIENACHDISAGTGLPAVDILLNGANSLVAALTPFLEHPRRRRRAVSAART
ncbi:MAG: hypothetical protein A2W25_11220 [candidate division Zixibacteria bacterium RBG_16_53_22]|nr:MAG: hypothetical protein A2W25_11220 [candidate division Zixibacteria bacterium RBG_16_53_22]